MEEATVVDAYFSRFVLPEDLHSALQACRSIAYIETQEELDELVFGPTHSSRYDVVYNIVGKGSVKEAEVIRCKNGASVNSGALRISVRGSPEADDGLVLEPACDPAAVQGGRSGARL